MTNKAYHSRERLLASGGRLGANKAGSVPGCSPTPHPPHLENLLDT
jgi:hypothetical protein